MGIKGTRTYTRWDAGITGGSLTRCATAPDPRCLGAPPPSLCPCSSAPSQLLPQAFPVPVLLSLALCPKAFSHGLLWLSILLSPLLGKFHSFLRFQPSHRSVREPFPEFLKQKPLHTLSQNSSFVTVCTLCHGCTFMCVRIFYYDCRRSGALFSPLLCPSHRAHNGDHKRWLNA